MGYIRKMPEVLGAQKPTRVDKNDDRPMNHGADDTMRAPRGTKSITTATPKINAQKQ